MGGLLNKTPANENIVTQSQTEEESSSPPKAVMAASPSPQQQQRKNNSKAAADDCCLVSPAAANTQEEDESTTTTTTSRNLGIFLQPPTIDQMWPFLQEKGGWTHSREDGTYSCDGVVAVCGSGNNGNRGVLQYMLQNGIPHATKYSPTELDMIERAVRSFHVPQNKDLLRAAVAVNNNKEIWPILQHKMGIKEMDDGSFHFPNNKTLLFSSLEQVRVHVREHGIFCQAANLTDEEKLFVLVWGSTSTEPLRTYSPPQRKSGKSSSSSSKVGESSAETSQEPETPRGPETPAPKQGDFGNSASNNNSKPAFKNDDDSDYEDSDDEEIDKILAMERELGQRNGRIALLKTQLSAEKAKLKRTKAQIRKSLDGRLSEAGSNIDHLETSKKRCLSKLSVLARVNCGG